MPLTTPCTLSMPHHSLKRLMVMHMSAPIGNEINFLKTIFVITTNSCKTKDILNFPIVNNSLQVVAMCKLVNNTWHMNLHMAFMDFVFFSIMLNLIYQQFERVWTSTSWNSPPIGHFHIWWIGTWKTKLCFLASPGTLILVTKHLENKTLKNHWL